MTQTIENVGYNLDGDINAVIDGVQMSIPDKSGSRFRVIISEWELADDENIIAPYVAPPTYASNDAAISAMVNWIDEITLQITGDVPIDEKLAWSDKEAAALAVIADTATATQTDMLQGEATLTGETVANLAVIIKGKSEAYKHIVGLVSGLRRKTESAIIAETDPYQYDTILAQAKTDAQAMLAALPSA